MSRKKLILSIFLMAVLVSVGIILPAIHHRQTGERQEKPKDAQKTAQKNPKSPGKNSMSQNELQFLGFEDLKTFFPSEQAENLKGQLTAYLQENSDTDITSVTFLVDETSYPSNGEILFSFALSDGSKLPVICQTASGTFAFGEEHITVHTADALDSRVYTRQTDDTLPAVTTEEIEAMQEGGYADTENTLDSNTVDPVGNHTDGTGTNTADVPSESNAEEVTP
ncbi:DUF5038 domain-containing protein [Lachnospiraceae bacterium 42-17]|jgi:hypothetical protein